MTPQDIEQLKKDYEKEKNKIHVPFEKAVEQIRIFERGIPYIKLLRPCIEDDGIIIINPEAYDDLISEFNIAAENNRIMKFVPASGAASRMFRSLKSVLVKYGDANRSKLEDEASHGDADSKAVLEFVDNIEKFAFYTELTGTMTDYGWDIHIFLESGYYTEILNFVLGSQGLNYSSLPKGCVKFHLYDGKARTAFEEHLEEAVSYTRKENNPARIHFTISPEHIDVINSIIEPALKKYTLAGIDLEVSYSFQKPSTDAIAVDHNNKPFITKDGNLFFRPAGHGALLENLNEVNGDIVFIKNIDNVAPYHLRKMTYLHKKVLAGYLLKIQNKIFTYLRAIDAGQISLSTVNSIKKFAETNLLIHFDELFDNTDLDGKLNFLKEKLNRPIRICGMVKNEGLPGGGPFWVRNRDGLVSLQIVEKTQIDINDEEQRKILELSTHFNPVDLACGIRDYKGNQFNLLDYQDPNTGLIVVKSKDGKELKALELPGLWNGSMAKWITLFIEVPKITFTPVKEVNDLLKEEHLPGN